MTCPEPVYDAEVVGVGDRGTPQAMAHQRPGTDVSSHEGRRPCPMCGEMILTTAARCRFCDEIFDSSLENTKARKSRKKLSDLADLEVEEVALAIFCTGIALVVGIVWMARGNPKGLAMIKVAVLATGIFLLVGAVIGTLQAVLELAGIR